MVSAVTIATTHKGKQIVVLGPDKPLAEHKAALKALRGSREHREYAEVHVLVTSGSGLRQRFLKPGEKGKRFPGLEAEAPDTNDEAPADDTPAQTLAAEGELLPA